MVYQKDFGGLSTSGLIGLDQTSVSWNPVQMFVTSLYGQGSIKENIFLIFINQIRTSKIQYRGNDLKKYDSGKMNRFSMVDNSFWAMNFVHVKIGEKGKDNKCII